MTDRHVLAAGVIRLHAPAVVLALTLAGCHADVTFRIDVKTNGTALITTTEVIDKQFYEAALSQSGNGDPFGVERLRRKGWLVSEDTDMRDGTRTITLTKSVSRDDLTDLMHTSPATPRGLPALGPVSFTRSPGLFFDRVSVSAVIPPLLTLASPEIGQFYSGVASLFAASAVAAHLELKTPGKLLATNGLLTPDGFVRWDLALQQSTDVEYSAKVLDFRHVLLAMIASLIVGAAVALRLNPRRRA
ncbi:MAG TPA: hypothetical protein VKR56_06770 [Candidatus Cybelea sp.]|nr:hypothetical protein [Candidatus Cybelea sp.]